MSRRPKHLAAGGGERPVFPVPQGRSEPGHMTVGPTSRTSRGGSHRILRLAAVLGAWVAGFLTCVALVACYQPADDTDNDTTNPCSEVNHRPADLKCEDDG